MRRNALELAFDLGNAYLSPQNEEVINQLKKEISEEEINLIWDKITKERLNYDGLEGYVKPLDRLKEVMMSDLFYLEKIDNAKIIFFGKNIKWCLVAAQGLIRKNEKHFFPVKEIVALGEENEAIAEMILEDLKTKIGYFEVSAQWAKRHVNLRASIETTWKNHLALYPLTEAEQAFVQNAIIELKFENVDLYARKSRDGGPVSSEWEAQFSEFFMTFCVGTAFLGGGIFLFNAAPPVLFYLQANALEFGAAALTSAMSYARQKISF